VTDVPSRSPSGARGEGDDFQHLVALNEALRAIRGNGIVAVTVEAADAGNVDDIVLRDARGSGYYTQVKHAVDGQTPVNTAYLLKPTRTGRVSLLQRFRDSWRTLGGSDARPSMRLVTDRDLDPEDPVFKKIDRRSGLLVPDFADRSLDDERKAWAEHLETDEEELLALLRDLHFETGRAMRFERELAQVQLAALGLASDRRAMDSAMAFVRDWVQQRDRTMSVDELHATLVDRVGRVSDPRALLVIEAIGENRAAAQADVALRFIDLYDGDEPFSRFQLRNDDDWERLVWPELKGAADALAGRGKHDVVIDGPMRLPMWFGAGCALRSVLGFQVTINQTGQLWSSTEFGTSPELDVDIVELSHDTRLAVVISVATDASQDGIANATAVGAGKVLIVAPKGGARNGLVQDPGTATALAEHIRDAVRSRLEPETTEILLHLATPAGLAVLLGHRWNRMRPTTPYEHTPSGYVRTFQVPA
jgi:hypothetical protein